MEKTTVQFDAAKRRRVMQRSQQLGHCICDPKRPCPCDVFTGQGLCPCAGERPAAQPAAQVRLTEMVHNPGCASKISPADLEAVLARLPAVNDPAVLSGMPAGDDAGIYKLTDDVHLVQTVDVMTPCVDDPYTFGRICAANCLSDIYAMGATPRTALSILAFPAETLDGEIMYQMMRGAMEVLAEAQVALIGGHSIKDEEIKLGFAITGTIQAEAIVERGTAQIGDQLVLTKPLGAGVLNFARQIGREVAGWSAVEASMMTLNRAAAEAMHEAAASACTDITGFGLFGHLIGMARHSGVTARVYADRLPAFPGALDLLQNGVIPGAVERNIEYVGADISVETGVDDPRVHLGFDAQTSGGLLIAVPADRLERLQDALRSRNIDGAVIGEIVAASTGRIELENRENRGQAPVSPILESSHAPGCCADVFTGEPAENSAASSARAFGALMRSTGTAGALDAKTKELINFALVLLSRCGPCLTVHQEKARKLGITEAELEEVLWCAVAMGGAPVRMFYQEAVKAQSEKAGCCQ